MHSYHTRRPPLCLCLRYKSTSQYDLSGRPVLNIPSQIERGPGRRALLIATAALSSSRARAGMGGRVTDSQAYKEVLAELQRLPDTAAAWLDL